jgi:moderate conductance mechanosensitive channel
LPDINLSLNGLIALILVWVVCVVIILDVWWLLPKLLRRTYQWVESKTPFEPSEFEKPIFAVLATALTALVLFGGGVATADILGINVAWAREAALDAGVAVGSWLGPRVARIVLILVIGILIIRALARILPPLIERFLSRRSGPEAMVGEAEKREQTLTRAAIGTVNVVIIAVMVFMILSELGLDLAPLLATAGVVGIAIGFGAQSLVKDFFSGIFILLEDQYRVGDVVRIGNISGQVEDISLRRTLLRDLDFIVHTIPNGEVQIASNFTKEKSRVNLNISVAYKEDLDKVIDLINQVGQGMSEDSYFGTLIRDPLQVLRVDAFEESGIAIKVIGETLPIRQWEVAGEFRRRIKRAFDEQGIEIPFPHLTVYWGAGVETHIRQLVETANMDDKIDQESPFQTKDEGRRAKDE